MRLRVLSLSTADRPALYFSVNKRVAYHHIAALHLVAFTMRLVPVEVRYVVSVQCSVVPVEVAILATIVSAFAC